MKKTTKKKTTKTLVSTTLKRPTTFKKFQKMPMEAQEQIFNDYQMLHDFTKYVANPKIYKNCELTGNVIMKPSAVRKIIDIEDAHGIDTHNTFDKFYDKKNLTQI